MRSNSESNKLNVFHRSYTSNVLKRGASHKSLEGIDDEAPNLSMEGSELKMEEMQPGTSHVEIDEELTEINHNPKICVLSQDVWGKIEYQDEFKKMLHKVKIHGLDNLVSPKGPGGNDKESRIYESFQRACDDVRSLKLEPLPMDLVRLFCKTDYKDNDNEEIGKGKPIKVISYDWIYEIFPNVGDIFLRETEFNLAECKRLCSFITEMKNKNLYPFERIFYKQKEEEEQKQDEDDPINALKKQPSMFVFVEDFEDDIHDDDEVELQQIAKMLNDAGNWRFQDKGQIAFCNDIYKHHDSIYVPSKVSIH